jgi:bacterioferritin-associated ferredoxin
MYVCNCNGIRSRQVDEAIRAGARRPAAVHAHHGCEVQCARCLPEIASRIREVRSADHAPAERIACSA